MLGSSPSNTAVAERVGVDEVMTQQVVADHADALRSHELLVDGVGLAPH
jgi:hypothetical protein